MRKLFLVVFITLLLVSLAVYSKVVDTNRTTSIDQTTRNTPPSQPEDTRSPLYAYPEFGLDGTEKVNNVHIISVVFAPTDADEAIPSNWNKNLEFINKEINSFFEREFNHQMTVTSSAVQEVIKGRLPLASYNSQSIAREVKEQTSQYAKESAYNVWMVYLARDKGLDKEYRLDVSTIDQQVHFMYLFWLEDEAVHEHNYGIVGSAHEFGHLLGIPHPWDLPENRGRNTQEVNVESRGDLMSYNNEGKLSDLHLNQEVKKRMGLIDLN